MNDLISRSALLEEFEWLKMTVGSGSVGDIKDAIERIKNAPAVDAEPVRHGRWYKPKGMMPPEHHGRHRCSVCDHMAFYERLGREGLSDYCPNCGARMNGENNEP